MNLILASILGTRTAIPNARGPRVDPKQQGLLTCKSVLVMPKRTSNQVVPEHILHHVNATHYLLSTICQQDGLEAHKSSFRRSVYPFDDRP